MEKILTIVVPTYNMEAYLERCLNSLVVEEKQMKSLEVLVIIDGSKDRSSEIGHQYEYKYPQIFRVIDKDNGNYGSCINRGLSEAKGKYIKVLDADDRFDLENFNSFLYLLESVDVDCIMSDTYKEKPNGTIWQKIRYNLPTLKVFSLEKILKDVPSEYIWMHSITYRTSVLRNISYHQTEGISYTDQEWIYLPMASCNTFIYYPHVVYYYLIGRDGQTVSRDVFRKNFDHEINSTIVMAKTIKDNKDIDTTAYAYLRKRLYSRCVYVYNHFFIKFEMGRCYKEMKILDNILQDCEPFVYSELNKLVRVGRLNNFYVHNWRRLKRPPILPYLYFCFMFQRIKGKLYRHIKK